MRLYYNQKKILGKPIKSKVITLDKFNYIIKHKSKNLLELYPNKNFIEVIKSISKFKNVQTLKEDFFWSDYYLPNNIIFYDSKLIDGAAGFVGKYYCVVEINGQIELIQYINLDRTATYENVVDNLKPIREKSVIKKIEKSFSRLYYLKKQTKENEVLENEKIQNSSKLIDQKQITGFMNFFEIFTNTTTLKYIKKILKSSELELPNDLNSSETDTYVRNEIFEIIINEISNTKHECIVRLDSGFPTEEFNDVILNLVKNTYGLKIDLNNKFSQQSDLAITGSGIFKVLDEDLIIHNFCLGFIDSDSDDYIIFVHKLDNKDDLKIATKNIGLEYFDSSET